MQLLIILALLLYGGKSNAGNILSEVKPVLESLGGGEMCEMLESAEKISSVLSALQAVAAPLSAPAEPPQNYGAQQAISYPLAPISPIADRDITYSLSKYIEASA